MRERCSYRVFFFVVIRKCIDRCLVYMYFSCVVEVGGKKRANNCTRRYAMLLYQPSSELKYIYLGMYIIGAASL